MNKNMKTYLPVVLSFLIGATFCNGYSAEAQQAPAQKSELVGPKGTYELITPQNSALILIDHQPQMAFGVQSIDRQALLNNVVGLAKAGRAFKVPVVLTTV